MAPKFKICDIINPLNDKNIMITQLGYLRHTCTNASDIQIMSNVEWTKKHHKFHTKILELTLVVLSLKQWGVLCWVCESVRLSFG